MTTRPLFTAHPVTLHRIVMGCGLMLIIALVALPPLTHRSRAASRHQTLTFEERVAYQRAIEEVYYQHRLWPVDNPQPKPPFDQVITDAALRAKVEEYLHESAALEVYWQRPLTAAQLQAELARMAQHSQQPDMLRELWAALGNDPLVIAECLARPLVAERELRGKFESEGAKVEDRGSRIEDRGAVPTSASSDAPSDGGKGQGFEAWWERVRGGLSVEASVAEAAYQMPEVVVAAAAPCGGEQWIATNTTGAPSARQYHTAVWTGSEMIVWGGANSDGGNLNIGGRYNPATDSWTATSTTGAPSARNFHSAVWTGTEMIVWGGYDGGRANTGGRYNPTTNSWTATSTTGAPSGRSEHTAVWTGSEMLIWAGYDGGNTFNTGGRYNPGTNSWTTINTTGAPSARVAHNAVVWTGSEMIIWGGYNLSSVLNTGGRYNPTTDSWTATNTNGAPSARWFHAAVWTGSEMIVWGGRTTGSGSYSNTGGRYNPTTDSWIATNTTGAPSARGNYGGKYAWTGSEMIVWGGTNDVSYFNTGGRYNPTTDSWTTTTATGSPSGRNVHTTVWTGSEMIIWGGYNGSYLNTGGRYSFAAPLTISPTTRSFPIAGGIGITGVTASGGCTWTATTNATWITITSGSSGAGDGVFNYSVAANTLGPRTGKITIGTQTFTVTQAGVSTPRVIRVVAANAAPGSSAVPVPIELVSQGDESALGFTLTFDPAVLSNPQATLGVDATGAQLVANTSQAAQGQLGLAVALPTGQKFAAGTRQLAVVTFNIAATAPAGATTLDFSDQVLAREVSDVSATALASAYQSGAVTVVPGYEADVTPRPNGNNNGVVTITDWVQVGRFAAGLDTAAVGAEFQRADCAPKETAGNGAITLADYVQAGRFAVGLDPVAAAGGPVAPTAPPSTITSLISSTRTLTADESLRQVRALDNSFASGRSNSIPIQLDARGDENALGFSLLFDARRWQYVATTVGKDASRASLQINTNQVVRGQLGFTLTLPPGEAILAGQHEVLVLTLAPLTGSPNGSDGTGVLSFSDEPVVREVVSAQASDLPAAFVTETAMRPIGEAVNVSAASFKVAPLARAAITSAFGTHLATTTQMAATQPLPYSLAGTVVKVTDSAGVERLAPLFFVSPNQVNYQIPPDAAMGAARVTITSGDGAMSVGLVEVAEVSPSLFSANSNGQGVAAAVALRVKADGSRSYEPVAQFDTAQNKSVALPLDLGTESDEVFLLLFGTGLSACDPRSAVSVMIGGASCEALYAGPQGEFTGLDQINVRVPRSLIGRGEVDIVLMVDGQTANSVKLHIR